MQKFRPFYMLLAILTMASVFMGGLFIIYLPFPFRVPHFYLLMWIPLLLLFDYKMLLNRSVLAISVFFVLMFLGIPTIWNNVRVAGELISFYPVFVEVVPIFGGILIFNYFQKSRDFKGLKIVIYSSLFFIILTSILSVRGLIIDSMSVRLAMYGEGYNVNETVVKMGIGGYGFFNGLMLLMPVLGFYFKKNKNSLKRRVIILLLTFIFVYPIFIGGLTTTFIFSIILFLFGIIFINKSKLGFFIPILIGFGLLFIFNNFTADILNFISDLLDEGEIKIKLSELSLTVRFIDYNPETSQTYFASTRLALTTQSLLGFLENPLIGTGHSGGHAYWLDRLSIYGLLGWGLIFFVFYEQVKLQKNTLSNFYFQYYKVVIYAIFFFGILKANVISAETAIVLFFVVPGILLIEQTKTENEILTKNKKN